MKKNYLVTYHSDIFNKTITKTYNQITPEQLNHNIKLYSSLAQANHISTKEL